MSGTFKLGRILGIDVKIHFSWVFIFALVAWSVATFVNSTYPDFTLSTRWTIGIISSLLLFVSVLIHEFSHSLVAISRGHSVQSITLFFLGGVSEIEDEAHSAGEEFWISFVGPLTSFLLGVIFLLISLGVGSETPLSIVINYLTVVNFALAIFNMIPAFPMDGGRVLKAIVWKSTNSESKATDVASLSGSTVGFIFIGLGVLSLFGLVQIPFLGGSAISSLWLVFIGWFIQSSASSVRRQRATTVMLSGKKVRDAMSDEIPTVRPGTTVQALVDQYINKDFERAYIVTLGGDTYQGIVTVTDVRELPLEKRQSTYITEIMTTSNDVKSVDIDDPLESALDGLVTSGFHQLLVTEHGQPVGLINRGDVLRVLEIAQLFPSSGGSASPNRQAR